MRSSIVVAVMILGVALAGVAQDNPGAKVCQLDGAWMGSLPALGVVWIGIFDSDTFWTGPTMIRFVGGDASLNGLVPTAKEFSLTIGTWHRTGNRSFECTHITYGLDDEGQPAYIAKINGRITTSEDCVTVDSSRVTIEFFSENQNPFGHELPYYGTIADESSNTCHRILTEKRVVEQDYGDDYDS